MAHTPLYASLVAVFLVGFIVIAQLQAHANDTAALTGSAATAWTAFISYVMMFYCFI
jgi:hypothetical protein